MPLNFTADTSGYSADAFFPELISVNDVIAEIPGLLGAFDAADYSGTGAWYPRIGAGASILPAGGGAIPLKAVRDGRSVLRFGVTSKAFVNDFAGVSLPFTGITYATRSYFDDDTTNFQKVLDFGAPEFYFRSTVASKVWQFAGLGAAGAVPISTPVLGWHRFIFSKSGTDAAQLEADGLSPTGIGSAGEMLNSYMTIGDTSNLVSSPHDISRIVILNIGTLSVGDRAAINTWLSL